MKDNGEPLFRTSFDVSAVTCCFSMMDDQVGSGGVERLSTSPSGCSFLEESMSVTITLHMRSERGVTCSCALFFSCVLSINMLQITVGNESGFLMQYDLKAGDEAPVHTNETTHRVSRSYRNHGMFV